jgi:biopolymer transport protein ExbD
MAMAVGSGGAEIDINVTPLVDVVLVLLIIFMVLTPSAAGIHVMSPQGDSSDYGWVNNNS